MNPLDFDFWTGVGYGINKAVNLTFFIGGFPLSVLNLIYISFSFWLLSVLIKNSFSGSKQSSASKKDKPSKKGDK
jgi:hypothetical protein